MQMRRTADVLNAGNSMRQQWDIGVEDLLQARCSPRNAIWLLSQSFSLWLSRCEECSLWRFPISLICLLLSPQYSLVNEPLIELTNPGASGSLFYLTSDDEFIIKTVQHKEAKFLQRLLPGYYMVRLVER